MKWKAKIVKACKAAGTYKDYFDPVVSTLAEILDKRDAAQKEFIESGARIMIEYTNKAGATNYVQNPLNALSSAESSGPPLIAASLIFFRLAAVSPSSFQ